MREPRNPFLLRRSERIESDFQFLRLFGPGVLDILPNTRTWENVHFLRSAPGGGKTSLMRLLTPVSLLTLYAQRGMEDCKELYQKLQELRALGEAGPRLLGIMISCARNYATIADMDCSVAQRQRLLFALLDARITLTALRSALLLRKLDYPKDLAMVRFEQPSGVDIIPGLQLPCTGVEVFRWASTLENSICNAMDSFGPLGSEGLHGHDQLYSFLLLNSQCFSLRGGPVAESTVLLFDDVHKLAHTQRAALIQETLDKPTPVGVWIAERFEALSTDELLAPGAIEGRDHEGIVALEMYWRQSSKRFEKVVMNIADRRARNAATAETQAFSPKLQASLDSAEWHQRLDQIAYEVERRVRSLPGALERYQDWIASCGVDAGSPRERAIQWRALEILIERENRKSQLAFDFGPLSPEELAHRSDSGVRVAAERFLASEFELPYYFGTSILSISASSNIEQFLALAGNLFEEVLAANLIGVASELSAVRQQSILKQSAQAMWEDIPRRIRDGREVQRFLESIGRFAQDQTFQPNAPYDPGVTGIAISMKERETLRAPQGARYSKDYHRLANVIGLALSYNLVEPVLDARATGKRSMILYLNRTLCMYFDLPLQYGGWRSKSLDELLSWCERGYRSAKRRETLLR